MNILQVYPGKVWGGAEQFVHDLGDALAARGERVGYVCRSDSRAVLGRTEATPVDFGWRWSVAGARRLAAEADRIRADVVHIHDLRFVPQAVMARRYASRPFAVVLTRHIARSSAVPLWERSVARRVDAWIFVSHLAGTMFIDANRWLDTVKCHVVLNSVPSPPVLPRKKYEELRRSVGAADGEPVLLFCGRVRKSKGVGVILKALAGLTDRRWRLVIAGKYRSERFRRRCDALIREGGLDGRVTSIGFVSNPRDYEAIADIGLAPSIVRESCGLAPMEFMAAGVPVITTTNGAQSEYIDNGRTGLLVAPGSVDELRRAIGRLLDDAELRAGIGRAAALQYQESLSYPLVVDKMMEIYGSVMPEKQD